MEHDENTRLGALDTGAAHVDVTVYVPCYNEEKLIAVTLDTIRAALAGFDYTYEVLIFNDASRDQSAARIADWIKSNGMARNFTLVNNDRNRGVGANYFRAAAMGRGDYFLMVCGDNAEPLEALRAIFNLLGKADVIIPYVDTRLFDVRYNTDHRTFTRRLISMVFAFLVRAISGNSIRYFNSCVMHRRANVLKYPAQTFGYGYQAELLCQVLNDPAITFLEVRFHNRDRAEGQAKAFRVRNIISVAGSLWRILRRRIARYGQGV